MTTLGVSRGNAVGLSSVTCAWSKVNDPCFSMLVESFLLAFIAKTCCTTTITIHPDWHPCLLKWTGNILHP